jgi:hypothetical protein
MPVATGEPEATAVTYEVRAVKWGRPAGIPAGQPVPLEREITEQYTVAAPAGALAAFAAAHPDVTVYGFTRRWDLKLVIPGQGERPTRRLMNWEKDPDAEVSDGWLSNIAAAGNSLADDLEWEPEFCHRVRWHLPCPSCDAGLAERYGKFGGFFTCDACGWKTGTGTKKAQGVEARAAITGWCGTLLEVRYNDNGVPYLGCKTCDPKYRCPTVNDVYYGRR